jgi:hypothetical protein
MGQFAAAIIYAAVFVFWVGLTMLYLPVLEFLGVTSQPAVVATGAGTLFVVALVLLRITG